MISNHDLTEFLEEKYDQYNRKEFIDSDPISIPHNFSRKEDIEISAFLTATISWGQRGTIIKNAKKMISLMDNTPYEFILNFKASDLGHLQHFVHRTFNEIDLSFFLVSLQNLYTKHKGLEGVFNSNADDLKTAVTTFRSLFFELPHATRTQKHVSDPSKGSAAKRLNMFLRWMVRTDNRGVDFGIWSNVSPANLYIPLDIHSGNVARKVGLLKRKQNDWKAVDELTQNLRKLDKSDPVKYDFALFGLGVFENF